MIITINGQKKEFSSNLTVSALLSDLGIDSRKVAVEKNLKLIRRVEHGTATLSDGDEIEIINFVGGG